MDAEFERARAEAEAAKKRKRELEDDVTAKVLVFAESASGVIRTLLKTADGIQPDIKIDEPVSPADLTRVVKVHGVADSGEIWVRATAVLRCTLRRGSFPDVWIPSYECERDLSASVARGNGPPVNFSVPASSAGAAPYFFVIKTAFDEARSAALKRLAAESV